MRSGNKFEVYTATHWALIPLVVGIIIGMAFSMVLLIQPYTAITNVYLELPPSDGDDDTASRINNDLKQMINNLGTTRGDGIAQSGGTVAHLADEVTRKAAVYYAIIMTHRHSADQLQVLRNTWSGQIDSGKIGYYIALEDEEEEENDDDFHYGEIQTSDHVTVIELANTNTDIYLDAISHICKTKINDAKWFLLTSDNVYIKSQHLEAHLQNIPSSYSYIGRPQNDGQTTISECMRGPGNILSHSLLVTLCDQIEICRADTRDIGECMTQKLNQNCNGLKTEGHERFLLLDTDIPEGSITEPVNADILESALTLYPITDDKTMYSIHQAVISSELNSTQHEMNSMKVILDRMTELLPHSRHSNTLKSHPQTDVSSIEDIMSWKLVNHNSLLSGEDYIPLQDIPTVWRVEIEAMMNKATQYLNAMDDTQHVSKRIINAYWRIDPRNNIHYMIDFESSIINDKSTTQVNRHRISFTRSIQHPEMSSPQPDVTSHVNIIVCFTSEHTERLREFMMRLEATLNHDQRIDVVGVLMRSVSEKQKPRKAQSVVDAKSIFTLYQSKYESASFTIIETPALLSRSHAVSLVLHDSKPSQILFLADLDLNFNEAFLERCRNLPIQSQQFYFPIIFSERDPSFLASINHTLMEGTISSHTGHWLVDSYHTVCIYAGDLLATSTNSDLKGIQNEVNILEVYQSLLDKGYEVIRGPDRELRMVYNEQKTCETDMVGYTADDDTCVDNSDSLKSEYLQTQLSALLFDHEGENSAIKY